MKNELTDILEWIAVLIVFGFCLHGVASNASRIEKIIFGLLPISIGLICVYPYRIIFLGEGHSLKETTKALGIAMIGVLMLAILMVVAIANNIEIISF